MQGYGLDNTLVLSVYAIDTLGATARATTTAAVAPYTDGVHHLAELVEDLAAKALNSGETDSLMQVHKTLIM